MVVPATCFALQKAERRTAARRSAFYAGFGFGLLLRGAITRRDAFLLRVLRGGCLDHRPHDRLVGRDPVRDHVPFLAVPLQELHRPAALLVHARHLERLHQAGCTELLQALVIDIEMLDTPAHLLAGERLALAIA